MTLKPFTYPFPETRFFHAGSNVYKFKIRYGNSIRGEEIENKEVIIQELERKLNPVDFLSSGSKTPPVFPDSSSLYGSWHRSFRRTTPFRALGKLTILATARYLMFRNSTDSIRAVLGNVDDLQPFVTEHFVVFPYKSKWERVSYLKFKHEEAVLVPYPFVFTLYVEMKWLHENLTPGKSINNSPLGLDLAEKKAAEATMRKRKLLEEPGSPSRAKMGTSSQGLSKKKPPVETRRSRERETQQEWQETPAFDTMDIQEQDSKWGYGFPEPSVPPAQQNDLPPPKKQGASGFFRFLSTLFPFRYFFKKSNQ